VDCGDRVDRRRDPHGVLDPPVKGGFEQGIGTFSSDGVFDGKPMRTRFV
jgi:hypothetical protein